MLMDAIGTIAVADLAATAHVSMNLRVTALCRQVTSVRGLR
jgi:hypothetical protein